MLEQLPFQLLDVCGRLGIGAESVHVGPKARVVGPAQLVARVRADLVEEQLDAGEGPDEHLLVHPVRHPGWRGVPQLRPENHLVLVEEAGQAAQPRREHFLVPVALDDQFQGPCHDRGERCLVQFAIDQRGDGRLDVVVPQQLGEPGQGHSGVTGQPLGAARCGEEGAQAARDVDGGELLLDHPGRQEVLLDEGAKAGPDLVLLPRDDGGVRDRQPQGMPEQRRDGEPVGQRAHHRCLGGGPDVAHPGARALAEQDAAEEDDRGGDEQTRRQPLHPGEVGGPLRVVQGPREGDGRSGFGHPPQPRDTRGAGRSPGAPVSWSSRASPRRSAPRSRGGR